ncbi:TetR/AcrR family transcriptional regulator [Pseudonocardia humida]|uniref:TetR/AcrR family transcriptional regulator n=1 Tax=Pseudonocardia humida TaxID=2800819 RepID=A0ABT1AA71_9PSEU|nr:TetR family transcriptional regulator [Pseudonocardia humida]MCO1659942.1 TetR/AcrR family transcriptional regulator [Pseudonocardia humida]
MSPRSRDPDLRSTAVRVAARVLAEEGPVALTARRVAREVGASTTAVYTYFGGMEELRREVRRVGFAQLDDRAVALGVTDDPVADLAALTEVYFGFGLDEPHLYRALFVDRPADGDDEGKGAFDRLVAEIGRCVDTGRFGAGAAGLGPVWAAQLWSMRHGMVSLCHSGALGGEQARFVLADMLVRLATGYGDDPRRAERSIARGLRRAGSGG